jgi:protein-S-isoprenylcysteine O-methyltransferase Ste14
MATQETSKRLRNLLELAEEQGAPSPWQRWRDGVIAQRRLILCGAGAALLGCQWVVRVKPSGPVIAVGLTLGLAGLALRSWGAGVLHKCRALATTGPYRLCRHPLYLGSLLLATGFCLFAVDFRIAWLFVGPSLALDYLRLLREEEWLAERFGAEWTEFAARVPRLLPTRWPGSLSSEWSVAVWRRNREPRTVIYLALTLAGLVLWWWLV